MKRAFEPGAEVTIELEPSCPVEGSVWLPSGVNGPDVTITLTLADERELSPAGTSQDDRRYTFWFEGVPAGRAGLSIALADGTLLHTVVDITRDETQPSLTHLTLE